MKKVLFVLSMLAAILSGKNSFAGSIGTSSGATITCPTSNIVVNPSTLGMIYSLADNSSWWVGTYETGGDGTNGYSIGLYRQFHDHNGNTTSTCYDSTPAGYGGYNGWIEDAGWLQWTNNPFAEISFTQFDGSVFTTTDGGVTWDLTTCGATSFYPATQYCPVPPTTSTSCFEQQVGIGYYPLSCAAGTYCNRWKTVSGHAIGRCITACNHELGYSGCGCDYILDLTPGTTNCPSGTLKTTTNLCIMPNTSSMCVSP